VNMWNRQQVSVCRVKSMCGSVIIYKGMGVSRLSGTESIVGLLEILQRFMLLKFMIMFVVELDVEYLACSCYYISENAKINTR